MIQDNEPLESVEGGKLSGFSGELLRRILAGSPSVLENRLYPTHAALMEAACKGEVDMAMDAVPRPEYVNCLVYSAGYVERSALLVARRDDARVKAPDFLEHARVIVLGGSSWDLGLKAHYPGVQLIEVGSVEQGLHDLAAAKGDVLVGTAARVGKALRDVNLDLEVVRHLNIGTPVYRFAAPLRMSNLIHELDTRLARLSSDEIDGLRATWLRDAHDKELPRLRLTPAQQDRLLSMETIRFGVTEQRPPFSVEDASGQLTGVIADYMELLGQILGLRFVYVPTHNLADARAKIESGELDMLIGTIDPEDIPRNTERVDTLTVAPMVMVSSIRMPYINSLDDVAGKRVAVERFDPMLRTLREKMPDTHLVLVKNPLDGLQKVEADEADVMIGDLISMDTLLRKNYPQQLKIAGAAGFDQPFDVWVSGRLRFLTPVLVQAIRAITPLERDQIQRRWSVGYRFDTPWQVVVQRYWMEIFLAALLILILAINYWRLRQQVRRRKETEVHLQHELALREALLASVPQPIAAKDPQRRYVAMNAAFKTFFGADPGNYLGATERVLAHPESSATALERLQEASVVAMQSRQQLLPLRDAQGRLRTVIAWAVPYREKTGEFGGVLTMYLDVTDIEEARDKAEAAERRLNDITASLPALVFQARHERMGKRRWRMAYVAGNGQGIFGLDAPVLAHKDFHAETLFRHEDWQRLMRALDQAEPTQDAVDLQLRLADTQEVRWIHLHAQPRQEGDSMLWNGVILDVTDRRHQAEALREAKESAEAALRVKESFLAMMSHEIRTPMNGVLGLVELLQKTPLTTDQQRMLNLAKESGLALAQILDDILDYAKIEAGRLSITPEPLDLRELFDGVLSLLQHQAHKKNLRLVQRVHADVPARVEIDGIRVRQILLNLLGNAIKFTDLGSVSLEASVESAGGAQAMVVIAVRDTGIGIPASEIQRLFTSFVQAERSSKRRFGGTGLGLTISRRLADLMGGQLTLESQENVGTTAMLRIECKVLAPRYELAGITGRLVQIETQDGDDREGLVHCAQAAGMRVVGGHSEDVETGTAAEAEAIRVVDTLPAAAPSANHLPILINHTPQQLGVVMDAQSVRLSTNPLRWSAFLAAISASLGLHKDAAHADAVPSSELPPAVTRAAPPSWLRVLVAEDHPINQEVIHRQLFQLGYASTLVNDGREALEQLEKGEFQVLITDCHMPVMDGFELTRAVRAHPNAAIRNLPVIGITATTVREELQRCMDVGMNSYVLKPTTLTSLQHALRRCLGDADERKAALTDADADASPSPPSPSSPLPPGDLHREHVLIDPAWLNERLRPVLEDNKKIRTTFQQSMHADRASLISLVAGGDRGELREWCHRSGGALMLFELAHVNEEINAFHRLVMDAPLSDIQSASARVVSIYDQLLSVLNVDS